MAQQYLRKFLLLLGSSDGKFLDLSALRCKFTIRRGNIQTPTSADVRIYNVSETTIQQIRDEFRTLVVQAGYDGSFGVVFNGDIKQVRAGRESPTDTFLELTAASGDLAYNFSVVDVALGKGYKPVAQLQAILNAMKDNGITRATSGALPDKELPRGKTIFGPARDVLRRFTQDVDANWSLDNGTLNLIPKNAYEPGDIPIITADTGMVGLPEQTLDGIKITTLLNPSFRPGVLVKLDNKSIQEFRLPLGVSKNVVDTQAWLPKKNSDGLYQVLWAEHSGDTRGQEWYTQLTCITQGALIPDRFLTRFTVSAV